MTCTNTNLVITVAQQAGSEGREIAQQLARTLQLTYVDEAVIQLATEKMSQSEIEHYLKELARRGRIVIVGCGANFILRDFEGVVNLLIRAPLSQRIERLMESEHLERRMAEQYLYRLDERYASFIRQYYGPDWTNPDLYDLTINTRAMPLEGLADSVSRFIQVLNRNNYSEKMTAEQTTKATQERLNDDLEQRYNKVMAILHN